MEKQVLLSVDKMKKFGFTDQEIQSITQKSPKRVGFTSNRYPDLINYEFNSHKFEGVIGQIVSHISPDSFFNNIGLKDEDVILSIGQYGLVNYNDEDYRINFNTKKILNKSDNFEFNDGDKVTVNFLRPKKTKIPQETQRIKRARLMDNYDFLVRTAEFVWLYEIENTPQINTRIELSPIKNLDKRLKLKLFNQDHAIDKVLKSLKINAAGLKEDNKPIGSFLFTGPTGVGKTELAKLLAQEMNLPLFRVDMSEFTQEHTASRFLGSPAGYIGYADDSYLLTTIGNDKKKCILLLDEMEKAHDKIQTLFLQAMDNARVTLANNKEIDFSNTLILMTSNCGVLQKNSMGITTEEETLTVSMDQLKEMFLPEFIGRLSSIVEFNALNEDGASLIIDKMVNEFNTKMQDRVFVKLTSEAKDYFINNGFNKTYGARPLKQYFANQILIQVAEKLLDNNGDKVGDLQIELENNELVLKSPQMPQMSDIEFSNTHPVSITLSDNKQEDSPSFFQKIFSSKK